MGWSSWAVCSAVLLLGWTGGALLGAQLTTAHAATLKTCDCQPDLGEVPMEAAILAHVHPLGPNFRPGGGQAVPLPTVNLLTLYSLLLMIALEIHHQLN